MVRNLLKKQRLSGLEDIQQPKAEKKVRVEGMEPSALYPPLLQYPKKLFT